MSYREVGDSPLLPSLCLREPSWVLAPPAGPAAHPSPWGDSHRLSWALSRISGPAAHSPIQEVMITWQRHAPWPRPWLQTQGPGLKAPQVLSGPRAPHAVPLPSKPGARALRPP